MMTMQRGRSDDSVFEMKMTRWRNPTEHVQRVVVYDGSNRKIVITWQPGEEKSIPSEYDRGIHMIDCGREDCHKVGWFCSKGHAGTIVGGGAPLLERVEVADKLDPTLDPDLAARKLAEEQMASAALAVRANEQALVIAAGKAASRGKPARPARDGAPPTRDEE